MGIEAEELEIETTEGLEGELGQQQAADQDDPEAGKQANAADEADEEVEILHADDSPTSEEGKKRALPPRRVRKLLERNEQLLNEKETLEQQLRLLQMQHSQKSTTKAEPPTLEACGFDEKKYQAALAEYLAGNSRSLLTDELKKLEEKRGEEAVKQSRKASLEQHYQRADALRVKDYDEAEEAALEVLGRSVVEDIAATIEESERVLYYLGKNPAKAEEIKKLIDTNPVKATFALGKLAAGLTLRPKTNPTQKKPDEPLDGGAAPSSANAWQKKLEAARQKAAETGDFSYVQRLKKSAREAGVKL